MVVVQGGPPTGKQLVVACRWVRSVRPHHHRSMVTEGPQTHDSSVDLHVAQLRAGPVVATRSDAQRSSYIIFPAGRSAIRHHSGNGEIASLEYSVIIRQRGGSASWCRRLVTTVKPAAVDSQPTIDRVVRLARAWAGGLASLPFSRLPHRSLCDRSHGMGQRPSVANVTADWDLPANQRRFRRANIKFSPYNAGVTRGIRHSGNAKNRKTRTAGRQRPRERVHCWSAGQL